jgi:hypothetical protein
MKPRKKLTREKFNASVPKLCTGTRDSRARKPDAMAHLGALKSIVHLT